MSITISLEEEEPAQPPVSASAQLPASAPRPAEGWKEQLIGLLKSMPPDLVATLFNREGLKKVLMELAQDDPLLQLCLKLHS